VRAAIDKAGLVELTMPGVRAQDFFGSGVALDRGQALVGVVGRDTEDSVYDDVGSAQLFERADATWASSDELFPVDRVLFAELGWAVALHGSTAALSGIAASAPAANPGDPELENVGLAYGFRKQSGKWLPQALELDPSTLVDGRYFGYALAALDDEIFVGSPTLGQPGSVHVYHWQNGAFELKQTLAGPDQAALEYDGFGSAIAATDDTLLVGAPGYEAAGYAYVYDRDKAGTWQLQQTLRQKRHSADVGDSFGASVSLYGDKALVGALGNSDNNIGGAVYLFERTRGSWGEDFTHEFLSADPTSFESGMATAIGPDKIWIGTPLGSGTVSPLTLRDGEWQIDDPLVPPRPEALGFGATLAASGRSVLIGCPDDDGDNHVHYGSAYIASEPNGASCETDFDCGSAHCTDGVCCDSACNSPCFSCRAKDKDSGDDGECGPVSNDVEPADGDCATEDAKSCGKTGRCDGHGECALYAKNTVCAEARCTSSSTLEPAQSCDGAGACVARDSVQCAPLSCRAASCAPCRDDGDCQDGQFCGSDGCEVKRELSASCSDGRECQSGMCPIDHCVDKPECSTDGAERVDPDGTRLACGPYTCEAGDCRDSCRNSADCQDQFACTQAGRCEAIPASQPETSSGGCGLSPSSPRSPAWIAAAFALAVALRRRRRTAS